MASKTHLAGNYTVAVSTSEGLLGKVTFGDPDAFTLAYEFTNHAGAGIGFYCTVPVDCMPQFLYWIRRNYVAPNRRENFSRAVRKGKPVSADELRSKWGYLDSFPIYEGLIRLYRQELIRPVGISWEIVPDR
jgi:hypothetical protein